MIETSVSVTRFTGFCFILQYLLKIFDECQLFVGEGLVADDLLLESPCTLIMALYEQDGTTVHLYYWRDGLEEEKAVCFVIKLTFIYIILFFSTVRYS